MESPRCAENPRSTADSDPAMGALDPEASRFQHVPGAVGDDLSMFQVSDLLAREAIRDLVARYNSYGDSGLFDRMIALFAPDAVVEIGTDFYRGRHQIREAF